ncbi:MAG: hypothetical protein IPG96_04810 [Proteobacteria bacterium]|nr:hypothetical protein [Pseudomonadota bacterium]
MRVVTKLLLPLTLALGLLAAQPSAARAQRSQKPAAEHFTRAVALFNEGDLRASLVEFQRAYELSPNPSVLYNIGQVHYQLQEYAAALRALTRFVAQTSPGAPNRMDAETTVETLRSRVGQIWIKTNVEGAELAVDEEVVGRSPLATPVIVSIGRRRVSAMRAGGVPESRVVDVAAGDTVTVAIAFARPGAGTGSVAASAPPVDPLARRKTWRLVSWCATGALAGAAVATGLLALKASADLKAERDRFGVTPERLASLSDRSKTFSLATDVLVGAAIVASGVSLYLQLTAPEGAERPGCGRGSAR